MNNEYLSTREIKLIREVYDTRFEALEKALELQAKEYERRLDELNNSHEKYNQDRNRFIDSDAHSQVHGAMAEKFDVRFDTTDSKVDSQIRSLAGSLENRLHSIEIALAEARGKADQLSVNIAMGIATLGLLTSLAGVLLGLFR